MQFDVYQDRSGYIGHDAPQLADEVESLLPEKIFLDYLSDVPGQDGADTADTPEERHRLNAGKSSQLVLLGAYLHVTVLILKRLVDVAQESKWDASGALSDKTQADEPDEGSGGQVSESPLHGVAVEEVDCSVGKAHVAGGRHREELLDAGRAHCSVDETGLPGEIHLRESAQLVEL